MKGAEIVPVGEKNVVSDEKAEVPRDSARIELFQLKV